MVTDCLLEGDEVLAHIPSGRTLLSELFDGEMVTILCSCLFLRSHWRGLSWGSCWSCYNLVVWLTQCGFAMLYGLRFLGEWVFGVVSSLYIRFRFLGRKVLRGVFPLLQRPNYPGGTNSLAAGGVSEYGSGRWWGVWARSMMETLMCHARAGGVDGNIWHQLRIMDTCVVPG